MTSKIDRATSVLAKLDAGTKQLEKSVKFHEELWAKYRRPPRPSGGTTTGLLIGSAMILGLFFLMYLMF